MPRERPPAPDSAASAAKPAPKCAAGRGRKSSSGPTGARRERHRLAQALHDTVCQELTGIGLMVGAAARRYHSVCPEAEQDMEEIAEAIHQINLGLTRLMRDLRSEP